MDLGDTEEILRARGENDKFNIDFFFSKIEKIKDGIVDYTLEKKQEIVKFLAKHHFILSGSVGIGTNKILTQDPILENTYFEEVKRISGQERLTTVKQRKNGHLTVDDIVLERSKVILKNPGLSDEFEEYKNLSMQEKLG